MSSECTFAHLSCRLLAHAFDPDLDKKMPREFIVYAIPLGSLGQQLEEFFELTLNQELRNGAHKSFPHVTLCQYFKVRVCVYVCVCVCVCVCVVWCGACS